MKRPAWIIVIVLLTLIIAIGMSIHNHPVAILSPAGTIAHKERSLMYLAVGLSAIVILPVFAMTAYIVWKYRATNHHAKYSPDWDHSPTAETIWWLIPTLIIAFLAVVTWTSAHSLDPYRPLVSKTKPLTIQVVALQWKWLFIYPEQNVASLNYVMLPVNRPVNFQITADAPMNSFWIPRLGGQIYAMSGMTTQLHLEASKTGDYAGSSANISGIGFADMHFVAKARSTAQFDQWVSQSKHSQYQLTNTQYTALSAPSSNTNTVAYSRVQPLLFEGIVTKYGHSHGGGY
jgi:cytochrome o ubiquinol oxidase subunit 2